MAQQRIQGGGSAEALQSLGDHDLLALIARGDPEALGVIYDRHIASVWTLALMWCRAVATAERVVQDAFLGLWRRPYRDGPRRPVVVRLLAVVRAACGPPAPQADGDEADAADRGAPNHRRSNAAASQIDDS